MSAAILILLSLLSAPSFRTREAAMAALYPATSATLSYLLWGEKHLPHLEGRRRCTWVVDRWYQAQAATISKSLGRMPWIDGRDTDCIVPNYHYWLELAQTAGHATSAPDYPAYAEASRLWVTSRIAARQPYEDTLRRLRAAELDWRWRHQSVWCW